MGSESQTIGFPQFDETAHPVVGEINRKMVALEQLYRRLRAGTPIADPPEPWIGLPLARGGPPVPGSGLVADALGGITSLATVRSERLETGARVASDLVSTAGAAATEVGQALDHIARETVRRIGDLHAATPNWDIKGATMLAQMDSSAGSFTATARGSFHGVFDSSAAAIRSIMTEWPDPSAPGLSRLMQQQQVEGLAEMMRSIPAGSDDGIYAIPNMDPIQMFRHSLDQFGGFMIADGPGNPSAPLTFAAMLPDLAQSGAKHMLLTMLSPEDQPLLRNPSANAPELEARLKERVGDARWASELTRLVTSASGTGYQVHAIGGSRSLVFSPGSGVPTTWAEQARAIRDLRVPQGERFVVYGSYGDSGIGSDRLAVDNTLGVPSYEVLNSARHSFIGPNPERVPLFDLPGADPGALWYNTRLVDPVGGSPVRPTSEFVWDATPSGS